ncbi:MAG: hypothetical protein K6G60_00240 [Lachnospiraceae bacterium]|nr:hypothetical protein [Lachnospiraceae bacterium]
MSDRNFDRLKDLLADEKYDEAINLLTQLNEKHARTASDFIALAKAYGKRGDFKRAEKMFKKAYRLRPSKLMYHDVMDVCLETGHIRDAEEYLKEYASLPAHDEFSCAVYEYKILKKQNADRKEIIETLQKINSLGYDEKWAYELAKQYYKAGMEEECKRECEKIVKNFELSPVASKAAMLLAYYNGEVTADDIKNSVPASVRRVGGEVRAAEIIAHPEEEPTADPATIELETAVFTEPSPDDMASEIIAAEASYGLDDIARGVRDIIEEEQTAEPEIEEITAEHSDPEIEEITAEHSDPEIEEIAAEHDPNDHRDVEGESNFDEDAEEETEEVAPQAAVPAGPEDFTAMVRQSVEEDGEEVRPSREEEEREYESGFDDEPKAEAAQEIDDEADIDRLKRSRNVLEEGFMRELNSRRFERTMPQYVLYAPKMSFSKSEIKEGKLRDLIVERGVDLEGICKNYFRIDDLRRSILKSLDLAVNEKGALCFVITGEEQSGKSTLALTMIHMMYEIGIIKFEKTAKISGDKMNRINLSERAGDLKDCNILIENAGELSSESLRDLVDLFGQKRLDTCLILEDNMKMINGLFRTNDRFNGIFNNRIHLPKYGTDELMGFAYDIFTEADYSIEASAADVFKKLIAKKTMGNVAKLPAVLELAKKTVANADERLTPDILKMAAEAAIENYNLVILEQDIRP